MLFAAKELKEDSWIVLVRNHNLVVLAGPVCSVSAPESGSEYFAESESYPDPDPAQSCFIWKEFFIYIKSPHIVMYSQTPYYGHSGSRRTLQPNKKYLKMKLIYFLPFSGTLLAWPDPDPLTHLNPDPIWIRNRNTACVTLM